MSDHFINYSGMEKTESKLVKAPFESKSIQKLPSRVASKGAHLDKLIIKSKNEAQDKPSNKIQQPNQLESGLFNFTPQAVKGSEQILAFSSWIGNIFSRNVSSGKEKNLSFESPQ